MALSCRKAIQISLATLGGHAAEVERLELEDHLATCVRCGEEHGSLTWVRQLRAYNPDPLSSSARDDIRRAILARTEEKVAPQRRLAWPLILVGAGMAALVGVGAAALRTRPYRVLGGDVVVALSDTHDGAAPLRFRAAVGGRVSLEVATADLARNTEVSWLKNKQVLTLVRGTITVDVEHQTGRHFEVRTPTFTVEVVGTRFTVQSNGVSTERGVVRVLSPDGRLLRRLGAGESWHQDEATDATKNVAVPALAPVAESRPSLPAPKDSVATDGDGALRATSLANGRLDQARHALTQGDAATARRLVAGLFRQGRPIAVEARVLFAESFLVEGRYADAIDAYRLVSRDFSRTDQAETSLFTIAQLQCEHGRSAEARGALRAYLNRYPHGRFVREVGDRLTRLPSVD